MGLNEQIPLRKILAQMRLRAGTAEQWKPDTILGLGEPGVLLEYEKDDFGNQTEQLKIVSIKVGDGKTAWSELVNATAFHPEFEIVEEDGKFYWQVSYDGEKPQRIGLAVPEFDKAGTVNITDTKDRKPAGSVSIQPTDDQKLKLDLLLANIIPKISANAEVANDDEGGPRVSVAVSTGDENAPQDATFKFTFQNIKGEQGNGVTIVRSYVTVEDMYADTNPVKDGNCVAISAGGDVEDKTSARLYLRDSKYTENGKTGYRFLCDLSGIQGIAPIISVVGDTFSNKVIQVTQGNDEKTSTLISLKALTPKLIKSGEGQAFEIYAEYDDEKDVAPLVTGQELTPTIARGTVNKIDAVRVSYNNGVTNELIRIEDIKPKIKRDTLEDKDGNDKDAVWVTYNEKDDYKELISIEEIKPKLVRGTDEDGVDGVRVTYDGPSYEGPIIKMDEITPKLSLDDDKKNLQVTYDGEKYTPIAETNLWTPKLELVGDDIDSSYIGVDYGNSNQFNQKLIEVKDFTPKLTIEEDSNGDGFDSLYVSYNGKNKTALLDLNTITPTLTKIENTSGKEDGIYVSYGQEEEKLLVDLEAIRGNPGNYTEAEMKEWISEEVGNISTNSSTENGLVPASDSQANVAWATDGEGNPGWRSILADDIKFSDNSSIEQKMVDTINGEVEEQVEILDRLVDTLENYNFPIATRNSVGGVKSGGQIFVNEDGKMQLSTVGVSKGGTGATDEAAARKNLGLTEAANACAGYDSKKGTFEQRFANVLYVFDFDESTGELITYSGDYEYDS